MYMGIRDIIGNSENGRKAFQVVCMASGLVAGFWFLPKLYPAESYPIPDTDLKIYSGSDGGFGHSHAVSNITKKGSIVSFNLDIELGHSHDTIETTYYFDLKNTADGVYMMENGKKVFVKESLSTGGHTHKLWVE